MVQTLELTRGGSRATSKANYIHFHFMEMLECKAVDVDLAKADGIMEAKRIADIADVHYMPIAPRNVSSPLGMMAACHVLASMLNWSCRRPGVRH